jgi:hypothetical protein
MHKLNEEKLVHIDETVFETKQNMNQGLKSLAKSEEDLQEQLLIVIRKNPNR